ncbi:MAG: prepilin-type N-terminal cleavage/methylation domain-containing protein [Patescibacteria group bacterium]|jgi:prepilin-type N-terminal cleavage/methylation domain-containing protein
MIRIPKKGEKGFTLLELLIVTAIFALTVVLAVDIFIVLTKLQRKTFTSQRLQGDARFVMELIAKDVRLGQIDYEFYDQLSSLYGITIDLTTSTNLLALRDAQGESIVYRRADLQGDTLWDEPLGNEWNDPSGPALEVCIGDCISNTNSVWESITPEGIKVVSTHFFITPSVTPFVPVAGVFANDEQPKVLIQIGTQGEGFTTEEQGFIFLQTTASTRIYER